MKILYHHRTLGDGAEGIHIREMVNAFRSLGHKVKVIGPVGEVIENRSNKKISLLTHLKSRMPRFFYEILEMLYNVYGYLVLRREIYKEKPDFIYDRYMIFNASCVFIGKRYNIPVFLEVNAPLALERYQQPDEKLYFKRLAFFLERWICSNSFKTIVVSTPLKDYLVSISVPPKKIVVMSNGVSPEKFKSKGEKSRELLNRCGFKEDDIVVGFVGILRPWHGLELLLEAFNRAVKNKDNLKLLVVGDGPIRSDIEKKVSELKLSNNVYITGRVPHNEVAEYVNLFDIAVSPKATFYASPMKILEYMALGKAIIAPDMANIRDILQDRVSGLLFPNGNINKATLHLVRLACNGKYRKNIGDRAQSEALSKRKWVDNATRIISLAGEQLKWP